MNKQQFFGRCLGQKVWIFPDDEPDEIGVKVACYKLVGIGISHYENRWMCDCECLDIDKTLVEFGLDNCQIIGRRISDMTDDEKYKAVEVVYQHSVKWSSKDSWMSIFNDMVKPRNEEFIHKRLYEWLFDKGIFPDEYFDKGWCVELKK